MYGNDKINFNVKSGLYHKTTNELAGNIWETTAVIAKDESKGVITTINIPNSLTNLGDYEIRSQFYFEGDNGYV